MIDIGSCIVGIMDSRQKLSTREAVNNPTIISEQMYRLGQYTADLEVHLGEAEEEYEIEWAERYTEHLSGDGLNKGMSATAAKQQADVDMAEAKGNLKKLTRYVKSSWSIYTGAMARVNHLKAEAGTMRGQM